MKIKILGCGSSVGVPAIGCKCNVCTSDTPFNKRTRSSILIESDLTKILVDFGPDIRQQLLREKISNIDAVILTHDHADHVNGIDDLKIFSFYSKKAIPIYSDKFTLKCIKERFFYMFNSPDKNDFWGEQRLTGIDIDFFTNITIGDIPLQFFCQSHGRIDSLGIKIGNFVYSNDVIDFPSDSEKYLENINIWVLDCLEYKSTSGHAGLEKVLEWNDKYKPKKIYLTNMGHHIDYHKILSELPSNIIPSYDGLIIEI